MKTIRKNMEEEEMTLEQFQQYIADGRPLRGEEMINFMRDSSDEVRRLLMELNCHYTPTLRYVPSSRR